MSTGQERKNIEDNCHITLFEMKIKCKEEVKIFKMYFSRLGQEEV